MYQGIQAPAWLSRSCFRVHAVFITLWFLQRIIRLFTLFCFLSHKLLFSIFSILKEVHELSLKENVSAFFLHSWLFEAFSVCKSRGRQHMQTYCLEAEPFGDYACQKVVAGVKGRHSALFELFGRSRLERGKQKGPVCANEGKV